MWSMPQLIDLRLSCNNLTGTVPASLIIGPSGPSRLEVLHLYENQVSCFRVQGS